MRCNFKKQFTEDSDMFNIIPQPTTLKALEGKKGSCLADASVTDRPAAGELIGFVKKISGKEIIVSNSGEESILLKTDDSFGSEEGYRIVCVDGKITVTAKNETGIFYAVQTLKQIFMQAGTEIPAFELEDTPRFSYRGYLLDCGRYFYSVEDVKRVVDLMALHKLNVLHWHLTEDQGWRVEIKKYPLLAQKASRRSHTNFGIIPHGGFYTQDEIREIVKYCHERQIKVYPEFDIPGHSVAAISCYPHLSCFDRKLEVATHWGVKRDILCAGKETTYQFVYDILDELMELFPDKVIHIGGDEAFKTRWKICPLCQKAIKEHGLKDEDDLQMYFMTRVDAYIRSKGYSSMMWGNDTEGSTDKLDPSIAWNVYKPEEKSDMINYELSRGRKLINTRNHSYYLDFPYGWTSIEKICNDDGALTDNDEDTLGVEACMWTEYVPNMKRLEFLTFPRLAAMAENAWAAKGYPNYATFLSKADDYFKLLDAYNVHYAPMRKAMPSKLYKHLSSLWFKRRVFHWQGLHILLDDARVERLAKKK